LQEKIQSNANLLKTQREIESLLRDSRAKQETAVSDMGTLQSALDRLEQQLFYLSDAYKEAKLQEELIRSQHEGEVADLQLVIRHKAEVAEQLTQQLQEESAGTMVPSLDQASQLFSSCCSSCCSIVQPPRQWKGPFLRRSRLYNVHCNMNRTTVSLPSSCIESIAQNTISDPRCASGGKCALMRQGIHESLRRFSGEYCTEACLLPYTLGRPCSLRQSGISIAFEACSQSLVIGICGRIF
jgi:hypothetical protein